jgi:hypothetical protein
MAPEQASSPHGADARSDLYSLGCTFYYLLAGRPPFPGGTVADKLRAHARQRPRPVRELRPDVPPAVAAVVDRLLAKRPADRYPSARALRDALDGLRHSPGPAAHPARPGLPLAVLVLALALLGAGLLSSPVPGPPPVPATAPEAACPGLQELTLLVQRGAGRPGVARYERHRLVARGAEQEVAHLTPLAPADSFRLEGAFEQPASWHLVWVDTNGRVTVAESCARRQRAVAYPGGPGPEFQRVDPRDPPGVHLLLLVAGPLPPAQAKAQLEVRLAGLGKPPGGPAPGWARLLSVEPGPLRGPGERVPAAEGWPEFYLRQARERMPPGLTAVHALFLPTEE